MARTEGGVKFKVVVQSDEAKAGFDKVSRYRDQFARDSRKSTELISSYFGGVTKAFAGLATISFGVNLFNSAKALNKEFADVGDAAENARMSVEEFSTMKFIAERSGVGIDAVTNSINKLDQALVAASEEGGAKLDVFKRLGLNPKDFAGLSQTEKLNKVADVYNRSGGDAKTLVQISDLLGAKVAKIPALFASIGESYAKSMEEARSAGALFSTSEIEKAKALDDKWEDLISKVKRYSQAVTISAVEMTTGVIAPSSDPSKKYKEEYELNKKRSQVLGTVAPEALLVAAGIKTVVGATKEAYAYTNDKLQSIPLIKNTADDLRKLKASDYFPWLNKQLKALGEKATAVISGETYADFMTDFQISSIDRDKEIKTLDKVTFNKTNLYKDFSEALKNISSTSENAFIKLERLTSMELDIDDENGQLKEFNEALASTTLEIQKNIKSLQTKILTDDQLYKETAANIDIALRNKIITEETAEALKNDLLPANLKAIEFTKNWRDAHIKGSDAASEYAATLKMISNASNKNISNGLDEVESLTAKTDALNKYNAAVDSKSSLSSNGANAKGFLSDIKNGMDNNAETVRGLESGMVEMWAKGMISAEEYGRTLNRIRFQYSSLGTVTNSFAQSVGENWGQVILGSKTASEALTGIWQGLASSIVSELMRIYVVQKIIGFIGSMVGNIGNPTTSFTGGDAISRGGLSMGTISGMAAGGGVVAAGRTMLVGEHGPELYTPSKDGYIMSNGRMNDMQNSPRGSNGGRPQSNMSVVVNANDASGVRAALNAEMKTFMKNSYYFNQRMEARS